MPVSNRTRRCFNCVNICLSLWSEVELPTENGHSASLRFKSFGLYNPYSREATLSHNYMQAMSCLFFESLAALSQDASLSDTRVLQRREGGEVILPPACAPPSPRPAPDHGLGFSEPAIGSSGAGSGKSEPGPVWAAPGPGARRSFRIVAEWRVSGLSALCRSSGGAPGLPDNHRPRLCSRAFIRRTTSGCRSAKLCCCVTSRLASYSCGPSPQPVSMPVPQGTMAGPGTGAM